MSQSIDKLLEEADEDPYAFGPVGVKKLASEVRRLREREKVLIEKAKRAVMGGFCECANGVPDDAQIVKSTWHAPKWGCDTLDHIIDSLDGIAFDNPPIA